MSATAQSLATEMDASVDMPVYIVGSSGTRTLPRLTSSDMAEDGAL
jgi:hypothetical protein